MTQPLKVNFTNEEATSKVREVPPSGEYLVNITDGKIKYVKPGKPNVGKPFWQLTLVIQEGAYAGTSLLSSIMLFDGSLYTLAQLMRALGYDPNAGDFTVPPLEKLLGESVVVKGFKQPARTLDDGTELSERFEVKGFKKAADVKSKSSGNTLLPK
jgi:hypothetical protein